MALRVAARRATHRSARDRSLVVAAACALLTLAPRHAAAQSKTFYLDRLTMGGAPEDAIGLWRPEIGPGTRVHGQVGLGFAVDPLRVENHIDDEHDAAALRAAGGAPVSTQLVGYFDIGLQFLERFDVSLELPVIAAQTGNPTSTSGIDAPSNVSLQAAALMDTRLEGRAVLLRTPSRSFKLAANANVWMPTGNEYSFGGDRAVSGGFGLSAEIDARRLFFVIGSGLHLRPPGGINDLVISSEWRWGAGAFVPLAEGAVRLGLEIFGSTGITQATLFDADSTPVEWMAEARLATDSVRRGYVGVGAGTRMTAGYAPDVRAVAIAGYSVGVADTRPRSPMGRFRAGEPRAADADHDGYPDDIDLCPSDPEDGKPPNPSDGCPALPDRDGDGIPDISDRCPDQPEDFDGVRDSDGCPEDDADRDGIADAQDACPTAPGKPSPLADKNGCPRFIGEGKTGIDLFQQVQFETGKSRILSESYPILDEVADVLRVNTEIEHLRIEGHTDNRGSDELNERLSDERAHSVMRYLVDHGVEAKRLSAQGFGPKVPIGDNGTPEGRKKNRRVELKLARADTSPHGVPPHP